MTKFEIIPKRVMTFYTEFTVQIAALDKYRILWASCGTSHTCALTDKGELFTWGRPTSNNTSGEKIEYKLLVKKCRLIS